MRARLIANGYKDDNSPPLPLDERIQLANEQVRLMLAPELRQGQKLNINRWLGNSRDDNANRVVDEPGENITAQEFLWAETPFQVPVQFATNDPHYVAADPSPHFLAFKFTRDICTA